MGKGDRKSKKGKIWRGSNGNSRPKQKNVVKVNAKDTKATKKPA